MESTSFDSVTCLARQMAFALKQRWEQILPVTGEARHKDLSDIERSVSRMGKWANGQMGNSVWKTYNVELAGSRFGTHGKLG